MSKPVYAKLVSQKDVVYMGVFSGYGTAGEIHLKKVLCLGQMVADELRPFGQAQLFDSVKFDLPQVKNIEFNVDRTPLYKEVESEYVSNEAEEVEEVADDPEDSEVPSPEDEKKKPTTLKVPPAFNKDSFYDSFTSVSKPRFARNYKDDTETFGTKLEPIARRNTRPSKK